MSATVAIPDRTIGALLIGDVLSAFAFGTVTAQAFVYYSYNQKDPLVFRLNVLAMWLLDCANLALLSHSQFFYLIENYAMPSSFSTTVWSLAAAVFLTALESFMVRGAFIVNVLNMSFSNTRAAGALGALSIGSLACGILLMIHTRNVTDSNFKPIQLYVFLALGSAILTDVCIAGTLCYYLPKQKNNAATLGGLKGFKEKMKTYVVGTGMLNIALAILSLILFGAAPSKTIFLVPFMLWSRSYIYSLLIFISAKRRREQRAQSVSVSLSSGGGTAPRFNRTIPAPIHTAVNIVQETIVERDEDIKYQTNSFGKAF